MIGWCNGHIHKQRQQPDTRIQILTNHLSHEFVAILFVCARVLGVGGGGEGGRRLEMITHKENLNKHNGRNKVKKSDEAYNN